MVAAYLKLAERGSHVHVGGQIDRTERAAQLRCQMELRGPDGSGYSCVRLAEAD